MNDLRERRHDHGALLQAFGKLQGEVKAMAGRLGKVEGTVDDIKEVVNMGKGAGWMLVRVGVFVAALMGGLAWLYERVK